MQNVKTSSNPSVLTALQWMINMHKVCRFMSIENTKDKLAPATNGELRRWIQQGALEVNFQKIDINDPWPPIIKSVVLFPKSKKRRCTLFFEEDVHLIQIDEKVFNKVWDEYNEKGLYGDFTEDEYV